MIKTRLSLRGVTWKISDDKLLGKYAVVR